MHLVCLHFATSVPGSVDHERDQYILKPTALLQEIAHRVRFARKENGTVAYAKRGFLLLPLLIHFGDSPCLDIVRMGPSSSYAIGWIHVGTHRARRLYDHNMRMAKRVEAYGHTEGGMTICDAARGAGASFTAGSSPAFGREAISRLRRQS